MESFSWLVEERGILGIVVLKPSGLRGGNRAGNSF